MSWRRAAAIALALGTALVPGTGLALDVDGSIRAEAEYDSNVQRVDISGTDDVVFRFTPSIQLLEDEGKFQWLINYRFPYELAVEQSDINDFRHFLDVDAEYNLSERSQIFFLNRFSRSDALTNSQGAADRTVNVFREPVWRNRATLGLQHNVTQRTRGSVSFTHRFFDSDLPTRAETNVFVGSVSADYALDQRHRVGGGVTGTYQDFTENNIGTRPARQAYFVNFFASWDWTIDEMTLLSVRGGPTYNVNERDAIGEGLNRIDSRSSSRWDFFAQGSLSRRWRPDHVSSASYIRTESTTSGLGSSVRDSVSVQHNWDISEFWKLALRGDWVRREATARAPGEVDNSDITSWGARVQLNRRLTRHLRAGVRYSYNKQSSSGRVVGGFSDFDNHLVTIGLQYDFDQFSLDPYVPW